MLIPFKLILIVLLVKTLNATHKPALCAGIYVSLPLFLGLFIGKNILIVILTTSISFGLIYGWFWLLDRAVDWMWFAVLAAGLTFLFIVHVVLY